MGASSQVDHGVAAQQVGRYRLAVGLDAPLGSRGACRRRGAGEGNDVVPLAVKIAQQGQADVSGRAGHCNPHGHCSRGWSSCR
ncbi:hypothetical protein G6F66_015050 [Rhizopus arrhizus]|nr:hypothetical protein G6F66_015050 [Rhizopus arrhizus]